jgi:hypothetical protein
MTCSCGQKMCYVCKLPVKDYSHFQTANLEPNKCPLWDNSSKRNMDEAIKAGKEQLDRIGTSKEQLEGLHVERLIDQSTFNVAHQNVLPVIQPPMPVAARIVRQIPIGRGRGRGRGNRRARGR